MKLNVITLAIAATVLGALNANAQTSTTTTVITPPAATIVAPAPPAVVVEKPAVVVEQPPTVVTTPPAAVVVEQPTSSTTVQQNNAGLLGNETHVTTKTTGAGVDCVKRTAQTNTLLGSVTSSNTTCQ
jgi:hypothetical protein